jgi:hypothetical protein
MPTYIIGGVGHNLPREIIQPQQAAIIADECLSQCYPDQLASGQNGLQAQIQLCWKWWIEFNADCIWRSPNY